MTELKQYTESKDCLAFDDLLCRLHSYNMEEYFLKVLSAVNFVIKQYF
jgi:hypothetical protein